MFMFKLGKSAAEMLQAWQTVLGDNSLKKTVVYDRYMCVKSKEELLADKHRSGRNSSSVNAETFKR